MLAVEREQVGLGEAVDLAVRDRLAVPDHPPQLVLGSRHLGHAAHYTRDEDPQRVALGLETRGRHVAEVLAVDLERRRPVALDRELVASCARRSSVAATRIGPGRSERDRQPGSRDACSSTGATRSRPSSKRAPGATWSGTRPGVACTGRSWRRARTRPGRGRRRSAPAGSRPRCDASSTRGAQRERRRRPGLRPPARPSASTARTSSASSPSPAAKRNRRSTAGAPCERRLDPAERDRPLARRRRARTRAASTGSRGSPSARGENARPAAGDEPDRDVALEPVHDLVEAAVAGEDVDPLALRSASRGELGRMPGAARVSTVSSGPAAASSRSTAATSSGVTRRRPRVDDQRRAHGAGVE